MAELAQPRPVVELDRRLGDALELEEQLVPRHLLLPDGARGARVPHREHGQLPDPVREEHGREPGHGRAPVVPDDVRRPGAGRVEHRRHVPDHPGQLVDGHLRRAVRAPEAPHVRHDHPEAVAGQERGLVAPQVARVRPAVDEQHRGSAPVLLHVEPDPADRDLPDPDLAHAGGCYPCWPGGRYAWVAALARASVSPSCSWVNSSWVSRCLKAPELPAARLTAAALTESGTSKITIPSWAPNIQ